MEYTDKINRLRLVREPKEILSKQKMISSTVCAEWLRGMYSDDITIYETFFVAFLNNSNQVVGWQKISQGGITGTVVDIRLIAKGALDSLATSIIMSHNHPSGTLKSSYQDRQITKKVAKALTLFDIKVLDHIIITEDGSHSMADNGEL
jgi:DNA repair protein RadC